MFVGELIVDTNYALASSDEKVLLLIDEFACDDC
jgi:hypothetical protein